MINKAEEMRSDILSKVRGGNGELSFKYLFEKDELNGKFRMAAKISIDPGCSIGEHIHNPDGEMYIIISGTASVNDNGVWKELRPGDVMWTADGNMHAIENRTDKTLELYALVIS